VSVRERMRLELCIDDDWQRVESVREAVVRCVRAAHDNEELSDALSIVAAELLENAVKYGSQGAVIHFQLSDEDGPVITVSNRVDEGSPHPDKLRERIEWLRGFADPAEAYLAAMATVYKTGNVSDSGSSLGILRIASEGECTVSYESTAPNTITVKARHRGQK
jgi:hypothetical protein